MDDNLQILRRQTYDATPIYIHICIYIYIVCKEREGDITYEYALVMSYVAIVCRLCSTVAQSSSCSTACPPLDSRTSRFRTQVAQQKKAAAQHALSMLSASAQHALSMLSSVIHGGIAAAQHALSVVVDAANPLTRKCTTLSLLSGILPIAASWPLLFPSLLHLLLPLIRNVPLPSLLLPFRWQSPTLQVFPASSLLLLS